MKILAVHKSGRVLEFVFDEPEFLGIVADDGRRLTIIPEENEGAVLDVLAVRVNIPDENEDIQRALDAESAGLKIYDNDLDELEEEANRYMEERDGEELN